MRVLVPGGGGYIGAHMCKLLARHGHELVVLDSLATGHRAAVRWGEFVEGSLLDEASVARAFALGPFDAVVHFAAISQVGSSVREPLAYYHNNVGGSLNLLRAMQRHGVRRIVFSSTAAIFGEPQHSPIDETHPALPVNPYGQTKLMIEQILRDECALGTLDAVALRYFNAAGADVDGELGEAHRPETHLIPLLLLSARGEVPAVTLFGADYPTPDGTCIRDYIHVDDLCDAHLRALELMQRGPCGFRAYNLGNGKGYSVREVLEAAQRVVGRELPVVRGPRRAGDAISLVAASGLARRELGWNPRITGIDEIISTAWRWHQQPKF